jgi:hypothetical protein
MSLGSFSKLVIFFSSITFVSAAIADSNLRQVGYFKGKAKNRVFTIEMKAPISKSGALKFAKSKPNTPSQVTAVYFYPAGSTIPADGVTLAKNFFQVNSVLYDTQGLSKWRFAYMKYFNGADSFVDCKESPTNDLCRQ